MRVSIPIVLSVLASALGAQLPVSHGVGVVMAVDFDDNGKDELVVIDGGLVSHSYTGLFGSPALLPGPAQQLAGQRLAAMPIINDRILFVVTRDVERRYIQVTSYGIQGNGWFVERSTRTYLAIADPVGTVRACALNRDLDGDGQRDLILAWTEIGSVRTTYSVLHAPTTSTPPMQIRMPALATPNATLLSIERAVTPSMRNDEYLLGFSASDEEPFGGFGFVLLYDGTVQAGGTWFPMLPTLLVDEFPRLEEENIAYGCFSPFPQFGVPLVKTSTGRSARLGLDPTEPFVARRGEVLRSSMRGKQLPRCIADYDDNGIQEMVWIEYLGVDPNPCLIVADPGPSRRQIYTLPLLPGARQDPISVHHGATGDFDGDGDPDIVLSVQRANPQLGSGLVYVRTQRDYRHGRTRLRRSL